MPVMSHLSSGEMATNQEIIYEKGCEKNVIRSITDQLPEKSASDESDQLGTSLLFAHATNCILSSWAFHFPFTPTVERSHHAFELHDRTSQVTKRRSLGETWKDKTRPSCPSTDDLPYLGLVRKVAKEQRIKEDWIRNN